MSKPSITFLHPHCMLAVGSTTVLLEEARRLVRDQPVYVVSVRSNPSIVAEARAAGVKFVDVGGPLPSSIWFWVMYPVIYWRIYRALRQINSPVVVLGPFSANWWGWFYKKRNPTVRLVYVCHEPTVFIFEKAYIQSIEPNYMRWGLKLLNPFLRWVEQVSMPATDVVVVNSHYSERTVIATYPRLDPARVQLIYCGIDHTTFRPAPSTRKPQIVMVGTLTKFKRADIVVRALKLVQQQPGCEQVNLVIKGKGVEKENLLQLADKLGIGDRVQVIDQFYTGEQLADLLRSSRVFVHAAHNEPFGLSPIESMACGTPAVVTGTGGTAETVENEVSGLYFNYQSETELAHQLYRLLTDEALWQRLSAGAIRHAQQFNWDNNTALLRQTLRVDGPADRQLAMM